MVHTRINERTANPNPYINFISALPPFGASYGAADDEEAKELLRALAAQLKPVMKMHGFTVNSFEEYESNKVFLGRNWNNGETVELVLRDCSGRFYPTSMLLGVFCHELAHIKHMNHSAAFHTLRRRLSAEVGALQRRGYYGDGYWSAGSRVADSQRVASEEWQARELPEYTCGGAHSQSRSSALPSRRRRRKRRPAGPSLSTGAQTAKQRKAGSRVTSKTAFVAAGDGTVLDTSVEKGGKGSGFRKQAGSQRGREERAMAAERRLLQMQGKLVPEQSQQGRSADSESEEDDEGNDFERMAPETDKERLDRMRDVMGDDDLGALRDDDNDIIVVSDSSKACTDPSELSEQRNVFENEGEQRADTDAGMSKTMTDLTRTERSPSTECRGNLLGDKRGTEESDERASSSKRKRVDDGGAREAEASLFRNLASSRGAVGNMVAQEMQQRRREALGMNGARRLGGNTGARSVNADASNRWACRLCTFENAGEYATCSICETPRPSSGRWACATCTYENAGDVRICEMCEGGRDRLS